MNELDVAIEAAEAAGSILRTHAAPQHVRHKGSIDLVTEVDLRCEQAIRDVLARHTPEVPVLAEEAGGAEEARTRWVVDPLDGTTNFVHRFPWYCVSVALEDAGQSLVGVIHDPVTGKTWAAARGRGTTCNGTRVHVSNQRDLDGALVATGFGYDRRERPDAYLALFRAVMIRVQGMRRAGSAALDLAMAAEGRVDAYYETNLKRWDMAAGVLLVAEAGGRVSPVPGGSLEGVRAVDVVATNPWIHDALLDVLAEARGITR